MCDAQGVDTDLDNTVVPGILGDTNKARAVAYTVALPSVT